MKPSMSERASNFASMSTPSEWVKVFGEFISMKMHVEPLPEPYKSEWGKGKVNGMYAFGFKDRSLMIVMHDEELSWPPIPVSPDDNTYKDWLTVLLDLEPHADP